MSKVSVLQRIIGDYKKKIVVIADEANQKIDAIKLIITTLEEEDRKINPPGKRKAEMKEGVK